MNFYQKSAGLVALSLLAVACPKPPDAGAPTASITSPAQDQVLSGTVTIQIDAKDDESGIAKVNVYAKARGSKSKGFLVGSSITKPFVVTWNTNNPSGVPNQTDLDLVAEAVDRGGNPGNSEPVRVRTQNSNVPSLSLVAAFTYPTQKILPARAARTQAVLPSFQLPFSIVTPPANVSTAEKAAARVSLQNLGSGVRALALSDHQYAQRWEWAPVSNADGYGIYTSSTDLAGPYELVRKQAADTSASLQLTEKFIENAKPGDVVYGAVTALSNNASVESGKSNADAATFLPPQDAGIPADGATIADGKPTMSWTKTTGIIGYQYFIYDSDPYDASQKAKILCTNFPKSTAALSVAYPVPELKGETKCNPLVSGTYYWIVVGISFDKEDKADGFTQSISQKFIVP
jgi:Bacterial Ig domain